MIQHILKQKNISKEALLFPVLDILLNGFNFLIIVFISWKLNKNDFGIFSALLALAAILFIAGVSVQTFVAKSVTHQVGRTEAKVMKVKVTETGSSYTSPTMIIQVPLYHKKNIKCILMLNFFFLLGTPLLRQLLRCDVPSILLLMATVNVHFVLSRNRGILQGLKAFRQLNISFYIEVGVRIITTLILLSIWNVYSIAVLCITIGMLSSLIHSCKYLKHLEITFTGVEEKDHRYGELYRPGEQRKQSGRFSIRMNKEMEAIVYVILGNGFIYYLTSVNIIIVNHRVPNQSGMYSLSGKFSLLIVAVIMSIITVLLPYSQSYLEQYKAFTGFVKKWSLVLFGIGSCIWLGYMIVLPILEKILFQNEYQGLSLLVQIQSTAYIFLGLTQFLISMEIVKGRKGYLSILLIASLLYTIGLESVKPVLAYLIYIEIAVHVTVFAALFIHITKRRKIDENKYVVPILERY